MSNIDLIRDLPNLKGLKIIEDMLRPCIYFLVKDDEIVYIGSTINILSRIGDHLRRKVNFDKVYFTFVVGENYLKAERGYINIIKPKNNRINKKCGPKKFKNSLLENSL